MTPESRSEMMTDDIEPVARAIWEAAIATRTWAIADDKDRALCRHVARAAIAADPVRQALVEALTRLADAAFRRDTTMGDPCRLLEVKAELHAANLFASSVLKRAGETP